MKLEFEIWKAKPTVTIILTRDSVCAADDCDAPHEKTLTVHSFVDPQILARALAAGYLPSVAGTGHSWVCILNGVRIAKIAREGIQALVQETHLLDQNDAHFQYHSARS